MVMKEAGLPKASHFSRTQIRDSQMKHYSQLTPEQRCIIYSMLKIGLTTSMIVNQLALINRPLIKNLNVTSKSESVDPNRPMHMQKTDNRKNLKIE